jgi:hypothetical protein
MRNGEHFPAPSCDHARFVEFERAEVMSTDNGCAGFCGAARFEIGIDERLLRRFTPRNDESKKVVL